MSSFENFIDEMFPSNEKRGRGFTSENFTKSSRVIYEKDVLDFKERGIIDDTYMRVWQKNLAQYEKICDHAGEDVLILGSKERRIENLDDVVTIPLAGWNVYTVVGAAGCGKSVLAEFLAEQLHYFTYSPSILHDRANEFFYHKYPQKNPQILRQLYSLGFEAIGLRDNLLTVSPYFLNTPNAEVQWGIMLDDLYALGSVAGKAMFQKFVGCDVATEDVSTAARRAAKELYRLQPKTFEDILRNLEAYNDRLREEKKTSNISHSFSLFLEDLNSDGIFSRGEQLNIAEYLRNHVSIDFLTVKGAVDFHELECYETYLASLVYEHSKPFGDPSFPNICEVFEEADIIFRSHNKTLQTMLTDKILKQRKEGNSAVFVTQAVQFFPPYLLLNSKAILTTKPASTDAMELIAMKNPKEDVYYRLEMLEEAQRPIMPQWAVITEYGMEEFYTIGSFGATHEVRARTV